MPACPYANPHSFRTTIVAFGRKFCGNDCERMQAWAQNSGHESLTTAFGSYGKVGAQEQEELVRCVGKVREAVIEFAEIDENLIRTADLTARALGSRSGCTRKRILRHTE
ncbi:MAG TPA: hypothetical protein VKA61_09475 [Sphingomicrobium sp.]|nr:hypothetical protein [Sphingomicrobium sp.]